MNVEEFKYRFQEFRADRLFFWSSLISLSGWVWTSVLLIFTWKRLPPDVPFFYSLPWGEEQLAAKSSLVFLTVGGIVLYLINMILAILVRPLSVYYTRIILVTTCIGCFLITATAIHIILLMT